MQSLERGRLKPSQGMVAIAVCLGCLLAYCRAFAIGFDGNLPFCGQEGSDGLSNACSAARTAVIVIVVVLGCAFRQSVGRVTVVGSGVVMALCGIFLSLGMAAAEGMPFALLAGAASGIVMLALMMLLSRMDLRGIVASSFGGLIVGGLLIMGLTHLPVMAAVAVCALSGLISGLLLPLVDPGMESCKADGVPTTAQLVSFPWFAAIAFAVSGLGASFFYGVSSELGWNTGGMVNYPLFGIAVIAALAVTVYIILQGEEAAASAWIPLFAVFVAAMVLACIDDAEANRSVAALLLAGVFSFHFLRWMAFPALISSSTMPRLFICGVVLVATSSLFGVGWGASLASSLPEGLQSQGSFVAFMALMLLILFAAALLVNRTRLESALIQLDVMGMKVKELESREPESAPETSEGTLPFESRVAELAEQAKLTPRETEIFGLTAQGNSSTYIAEVLVISANTVRFHQQNIYRKFDVHSRQELLGLVHDKEVS